MPHDWYVQRISKLLSYSRFSRQMSAFYQSETEEQKEQRNKMVALVVIHYTLFPASLGTLEFDLLYERATSSLHCTVLKAKVKIRFTHTSVPLRLLSSSPTLSHLLLFCSSAGGSSHIGLVLLKVSSCEKAVFPATLAGSGLLHRQTLYK